MTESRELEVQKHIRCRPGDVARCVLLPGDPARAHRIAEALEEARVIAENREYVVITGKTNGVAVSVCSTGIGGSSAAIALEELRNVGAEVFIRVGSAGGRRADIRDWLPGGGDGCISRRRRIGRVFAAGLSGSGRP